MNNERPLKPLYKKTKKNFSDNFDSSLVAKRYWNHSYALARSGLVLESLYINILPKDDYINQTAVVNGEAMFLTINYC